MMKPATNNPKLTPKLRFPEFRDAPGWEEKELRNLADPVSARADNEDANNILTLSTQQGLVLQSEYFGKQIAGTNAERYLKIQRDDFVYNDRTTKTSAYGTIKRLTKHPHGIVSPIYKCFRFKKRELPSFWEWYFEAGAHEEQLRSLANEGARAGRFNVSIDRFLAASVWAPDSTSQEQHKIASCLSSLDELLGAEARKLNALKAHNRGLMQHLFPREGETIPRLRFPEFRNAPEWEEKTLGGVVRLRNGYAFKSSEYVDGGPYQIITIANVQQGLLALDSTKRIAELPSDIQEHQVLCLGDILISMTGNVGRVCRVTATGLLLNQRVGKLIPDTINHAFFYQLLQRDEFRNTMQLKAAGGAQGNLSAGDITEYGFSMPTDPDEQHRIATCLSALDGLITAQCDKLSILTTHKQGLMQQLFPSPEELEA
jgi:type I restriction enzyme S subunit